METNKKIASDYLPPGRTIKYVPLENQFMRAAEKEAWMHSTDRRMPTGAVVVANNNVVSRASNKAPLTNTKLLAIHKDFCIRRIFKIPSGEKYWLCPGCAGASYHAETRACKNIPKEFSGRKDLDLYLFGHFWCCEPCWNSMISTGIRDVYLLENSKILFNEKAEGNIIGHQLDHFVK
jgi:deoxycytidylate deaminase